MTSSLFSRRRVISRVTTLTLVVATRFLLLKAPLTGQVRRIHRQPYDGATLVRGVFLGSGPVAALMPEIWDHPELRQYRALLSTPESLAMQDLLVEKLRGSPAPEPSSGNFLEWFAIEVQSGDHVRVNEAMLAAQEAIWKASMEELARRGLPTIGQDRNSGTCLLVALVAAVAVAVFLGVVVTVANALSVDTVVHLQRSVPKPQALGGTPSLEQEVWVDLMVSRLALTAQ